MGDYRKTKMNWSKPSVNKMIPSKTLSEAVRNGQHKLSSPWDLQEDDVVEDFNRTLESMNATVKGPWEERSTELRAQERNVQAAQNYQLKSFFDKDPEFERKEEQKRQAAQDYKYHSMFEVPPLTEKQQRVIDDYKMNPPFRTSYNITEEPKKSAKKLAPGKNPPTRQPWTYGSVPADPVPKKIFERPSTSLWSVPPKQERPEDNLPSSGDPVLDSLRIQLRKHGAAGIAGLARKFRIMDDDQSGTLSMSEFVKGMKECKIADLSEKALKHLFLYFDKDDSGVISYDEFLVGVRGVLNPRRKQLVHLAFRILDRDGSGQVDVTDIQGVYNASSHPDVLTGKRSEEEILTEFLLAFQVGKDRDEIITREEFENYYANLSASIDSDDYFELMIRNAWHISGGEGWCANTTNRRVLVTHADGRQTVEEIQNDLGLQANDKKGMVQRLKAQGLQMASINTNGLGDMGNQYEDPDFVQYRQQQQQQSAQQEEKWEYEGTANTRSAPNKRAGVLGDYTIPSDGKYRSGTGTSGRPGTASGTQRLSDFASSGNRSHSTAGATAAVGSAYTQHSTAAAPPRSTATTAAVKPVSLAAFVSHSNSSSSSSSRSLR